MKPSEIAQLLADGRYRLGSEALLQQDIADHLNSAGHSVEREVHIGPGCRIDFMLEAGLGIEAKVKCSGRVTYRQLERYAACEAISALILITGTALGLPKRINGKEIYLVSLGRCAL